MFVNDMFTADPPCTFPVDASTPARTDADCRDAALTRDVQEVLAEHRSLRPASLQLRVHGGVAHVRAVVETDEERQWLRRTIARVRGIDAVWDAIEVQGEAAPLIVDVGCGARKQKRSAFGVDRHPYGAVDVVADLEHTIPLADASVDHVFAVHFLEHVRELLGLMNEIHRVLKPTGMLHVMVPNCTFVNAVADPTHVRFFNQHTFKFFCRPYPGLRLFRPITVATTHDNILADLQPVPANGAPPSEEELARCFG